MPRAGWANLIASAPLVVVGLQSSATAIENARTANFAQGTTGVGVLAAGIIAFDGANWTRIIASPSTIDNVSNTNAGLFCNSFGFVFNGGSGWNRHVSSSAANVSATAQPSASLIAFPGEWSQAHTPVAATQATTTKAAGGAGVRHVCRSISFSLMAVGLQGAINFNLRDGASGAGTILWSMSFSLPIGGHAEFSVPVNVFGTANTAMTLESSAAPAATNFASVAMTGYSTN